MTVKRHLLVFLCAIPIIAIGFFAAPYAAHAIAAEETSEETYISIPLPLELSKPSDEKAWARFFEVIHRFSKDYYRVINAEEAVQKMIDGGLVSLDPHTSIMDEKEFAEMQIKIKGVFGGLGLEVNKNENGKPGILVVSPIDDTPASRAGIKAQDVIIEIDGKSTDRMPLKEAVDLMRGEPDTTVILTIWRDEVKKPFSVTLTRAIIKMVFVKYELKKDGVGYIRITSFDGETVPGLIKDAVKNLVKKNKGKKLSGVVLDLQNNPGGLLNIADDVNNLFLDGISHYVSPDMSKFGPASVTISEESREKISAKYHVGLSPDITGGVPLVVLINGGSASASEIVARTLQVYGRALVAGPRKSFGKGTVQSIIPLQTGGALRLTSSQYLIGPAGCEQVIQNVGVIPDITVKEKVKEKEKDVVEWQQEESKLAHAIERSTISNENCKYRYAFPEEQREMVLKMLDVMNLTVVAESKKEDDTK